MGSNPIPRIAVASTFTSELSELLSPHHCDDLDPGVVERCDDREQGNTQKPEQIVVPFTGEEPIGIFPFFELTKGPLTTAFSPPPLLWVPHLGPALLNVGRIKTRKREVRTKRFIDGCFEWLVEEVRLNYLMIRTDWRYPVVRPLQWNDCDLTPLHAYVVDLRPGSEELFQRFGRSVRRNVRKADEREYEIEVGNADDVKRLIERVRGRYRSQGLSFGMPLAFALDLHAALPKQNVRPYVCRIDGRFVGGILLLEQGERVC